jgi:hypothetical protein
MTTSEHCLSLPCIAKVGGNQRKPTTQQLSTSDDTTGLPNLREISRKHTVDALPHSNVQFSSAGFIAQTLSTDSSCKAPDLSMGMAANVCFVEVGFAYKVRLVQDACAGGVIEYYYDKDCTKLAGTSKLDETLPPPCSSSPFLPGAYLTFVCTNKSKPPVGVDSVVSA